MTAGAEDGLDRIGVNSKEEAETVMAQAGQTGTTIVRQDSFYDRYAGYFQDRDGQL